MDHLKRSKRNCFAAGIISRISDKRNDKNWIAQQLTKSNTRIVLLWRGKNLIDLSDAPQPIFLQPEQLKGYDLDTDICLLLGEKGGQFFYAIDLPSDDETIHHKFNHLGQFKSLRSFGALIENWSAELLAYAKALTYWHQNRRFCGRCGQPTIVAEGGHMLICSNQDCGHKQFPRTDPAIIVIVTYQDKCLLGRQPSWPLGMYANIAGFVEPGESLESAVVREVLEETGIEVTAVHYLSSQPWPFPCSIMLGFNAEARDTSIHSGDRELEDARWFSREDIIAGLRDNTLKLPNDISISYRLIEYWFDSGSSGYLADIIADSKNATN